MRAPTYLLACSVIGLLLMAAQGFAQLVYTPYAFTTLAGLAGSSGSADGAGSEARFFLSWGVSYFNGGVAVDSAGNFYVADTINDQ